MTASLDDRLVGTEPTGVRIQVPWACFFRLFLVTDENIYTDNWRAEKYYL